MRGVSHVEFLETVPDIIAMFLFPDENCNITATTGRVFIGDQIEDAFIAISTKERHHDGTQEHMFVGYVYQLWAAWHSLPKRLTSACGFHAGWRGVYEISRCF